MNTLKTIFFAGALLAIFSCNSDSHQSESAGEITEASMPEKFEINSELKQLMESVPSPLEFSLLILSSGSKYSEAYLNKTENASNYNSDSKKAINLGVYGADLGYINLYGKTYSAIEYLNTVYRLSVDLKIDEFFDFETIKRLASNSQDVDSITHITTVGFEKMNEELNKSQRGNISALILLGGWVEGLHLTCEIVKNSKTDTKRLMEAIYDENVVMEDLIKIAENYKTQPVFDKAYPQLVHFKETYQKVTQNSNDLTHEQFVEISNEIEKIRATIIE